MVFILFGDKNLLRQDPSRVWNILQNILVHYSRDEGFLLLRQGTLT